VQGGGEGGYTKNPWRNTIIEKSNKYLIPDGGSAVTRCSKRRRQHISIKARNV
jgi:hypothetical protein